MVKDSWFSNLWKKKMGRTQSEKVVIGMLSFEVASLMSKVVHLWNCLKDENIVRIREEIFCSVGIRKLVSDDDEYVIGLVCGEMVENLSLVVRSVVMVGKKCNEGVLQRLDSVFDDLDRSFVDLVGWEFTGRKMDKKVRKMEKFIGGSANLYQELEVLCELEQVLRRMQGSGGDTNSGARVEMQKKVLWQKHEVRHLREGSLWNRSYDYVVRLLARSICTIFRRIKNVFGIHWYSRAMSNDSLNRSNSYSALTQSSVHPAECRFASGPLERATSKSGQFGRYSGKSGPLGGFSTKSGPLGRSPAKSARNSGPINGKWENYAHFQLRPPRSKTKTSGAFKGCMMGGNKSPVISGYMKSNGVGSGILNASKCRLLTAPPWTLGAAALALHYANLIVVIEKLVQSPHLIGPDARDDLYSMLPNNVKSSLRARLKSYANTASSFFDTDLAAEWSEALSRILEWLAPLAHNMIRWQSERNFQQQHMISRTNVLLVHTLYFANQAKTEAAVTELLVGLNYLWRFGRELNEKALMECASSGEFDDYLDYKD